MAVGTRTFLSLDSRRLRIGAAGVVTVALVALSALFGHRDAATEPLYPDRSAQTSTSTAAHAQDGAVTPSTAPGTVPATVKPVNGTCPNGKLQPGFGCPIHVENFDGSTVDTGDKGWSVYDYPTANFPRVAPNFRVQGGEAQLMGTYDRSTGKILGAGIASHVSQKYGRWELRARVDVGRGFSAASLLWPTNENWPADGEVDLFEIPNGDRQSIYHVVHNGPRNLAQSSRVAVDATKWHNYAVEWTPTKLTYLIDDEVRWTVTKPAYVPTTGNLNLTIQLDPGTPQECGRWFQCPDASTPALTMLHVDSVHIWSYSPGSK